MKNKFLIIFFFIIFNVFAEEPNIKELFKISSLWQVGDNKIKVQKARDQLVQMGEKSLEWIYENEFGKEMTTLKLRAINYIFRKNDKNVKFILNKFKTEKNVKKLGLLIYLSGLIKDKSFIPYLQKFQKNKKLAYTSIIALSHYDRIYSVRYFKKVYKNVKLPRKLELIHIISVVKNKKLLNFLKEIKIKAQKKNEPLIYYACVKVEKDLK